MRTAVFVGSFDPFTVGHADIVSRALKLFDRLVIGVVNDNARKPAMTAAVKRRDIINRLYAGEKKVEVKIYDGLAARFAEDEGAAFIIRGIRDAADMEYERMQAYYNRLLGGVDTLLFFAGESTRHISSSAVRELIHFGVDVTPFLPQPPLKKEEEKEEE